LAWNVLRDYLLDKGHQNIHGSKDATRAPFKLDLIRDGDSWMDMIRDRNRTSHTYNQETVDSIANNIKQRFFGLFVELRDTLRNLPDDND
jgi:nucleotidyltransferase substrate binding protein (TIGR01987 family)